MPNGRLALAYTCKSCFEASRKRRLCSPIFAPLPARQLSYSSCPWFHATASQVDGISWEDPMHFNLKMTRRDTLKFALGTASAATLARWTHTAAAAGTVNFADIGVGDPGGDWSRYTQSSGYGVNLVSIGNAPSAILNVLVAGGGTGTYDIINIVGGMQKPLVDNNLIEALDISKLPNWA